MDAEKTSEKIQYTFMVVTLSKRGRGMNLLDSILKIYKMCTITRPSDKVDAVPPRSEKARGVLSHPWSPSDEGNKIYTLAGKNKVVFVHR